MSAAVVHSCILGSIGSIGSFSSLVSHVPRRQEHHCVYLDNYIDFATLVVIPNSRSLFTVVACVVTLGLVPPIYDKYTIMSFSLHYFVKICALILSSAGK